MHWQRLKKYISLAGWHNTYIRNLVFITSWSLNNSGSWFLKLKTMDEIKDGYSRQ